MRAAWALAVAILAAGCRNAVDAPAAEDTVAPAAVRDLRAFRDSGGIYARWTAVGDDSLAGTAGSYEMRCYLADSVLEHAEAAFVWNAGTAVPDLPHPVPAGRIQTARVADLPDTGWVLAVLRARDEAGNPSGLSNVAVCDLDLPAPAETAWVPLGLDDAEIAAILRIASTEESMFAIAGLVDSPGPAIVRVRGAAWSLIGPPDALRGSPEPEVLCIAARGEQAVIGGRFQSLAEPRLRGIAAWDGAGWRPLGHGIDGIVRALAWKGDTLIAGGEFSLRDVPGARCIAAWDGASWFPLGAGIDGPVLSLEVSPSGLLAAGGSFTRAGVEPVENVAVWDGARWIATGPGLPGPVADLTWWGDRLVACRGEWDGSGQRGDMVFLGDGATWVPILDARADYATHAGPDGLLYLFDASGSSNLRVWADARWQWMPWCPGGHVATLTTWNETLVAGTFPLETGWSFVRYVPPRP